jgi:transposase InsO family protein
VSPAPLALAGPDPRASAIAPPAAGDAQHVERLQALRATAAAPEPRRRGNAWQQPRRLVEREVRQEGVAFRHWVAARGLTRIDCAACLGIAVRTLRAWEQRLGAASPVLLARGRPVVRSERAARTVVLEFLGSVGPGVGLAVLAGQFPDLAKAELADLLKRYRRVWARRQAPLHVLHWPRPGTVWAIDYAEPPQPLEESYTDLLAVRDLASGMQLLWLPVAEATAATTSAALLSLFTLYRAPLVLKLDNGSPFVAPVTRELLAQWQVLPLYSPPGRPQYNGAIEAGIGALKVRTHYQAVRQGRPGEWTLADAEAARLEANALARPWGAHGPTPAERWAGRHLVTERERRAFAASVACLEEEAASPSAPARVEPTSAAGVAPEPPSPAAGEAASVVDHAAAAASGAVAEPREPGQPAAGNPQSAAACGTDREGAESNRGARDRAARQRQAISRALVAQGYLLFRRRRIPLPIKRKKVA